MTYEMIEMDKCLHVFNYLFGLFLLFSSVYLIKYGILAYKQLFCCCKVEADTIMLNIYIINQYFNYLVKSLFVLLFKYLSECGI